MKVHRLNLALSQGDYAVVRRMAGLFRLPVGTWARQVLVVAAMRECKAAQADGRLAEWEQLELFESKQLKRRGS